MFVLLALTKTPRTEDFDLTKYDLDYIHVIGRLPLLTRFLETNLFFRILMKLF